ncbi:hypothetical protein OWR29_37330 [Actinoplanes sp. Pm04-4]|uniref:Uncharacterized protein n=1 Tax=Paractinoplanes pyxinae TaxID=2997416 RepID=A0ABT4BDL7_9ACTN|nr:hypothetical protein [Actinoplanes pyxinae]MCY1143698.1 hypothetical protein [Actinoplanes pyxinae]
MRPTALLAPLFLLAYGIARWIDGWDGDRHNGPAWDIGHVAFFIGMALFGILAVQLRGMVPARRRGVATAAAVAAVLGVASFLWVIVGDLYGDFPPLAEWLEMIGPALFGLGLLTLLGLLAAARRVPLWSPVLFLAGYVSISVRLDLLPYAAAVILMACLPLALPSREPAPV